MSITLHFGGSSFHGMATSTSAASGSELAPKGFPTLVHPLGDSVTKTATHTPTSCLPQWK